MGGKGGGSEGGEGECSLGVLGDVFRFPLWPVLQYLELLWLQVKKMRENEWKVSGLVPGCSWLEESFL